MLLGVDQVQAGILMQIITEVSINTLSSLVADLVRGPVELDLALLLHDLFDLLLL